MPAVGHPLQPTVLTQSNQPARPGPARALGPAATAAATTISRSHMASTDHKARPKLTLLLNQLDTPSHCPVWDSWHTEPHQSPLRGSHLQSQPRGNSAKSANPQCRERTILLLVGRPPTGSHQWCDESCHIAPCRALPLRGLHTPVRKRRPIRGATCQGHTPYAVPTTT